MSRGLGSVQRRIVAVLGGVPDEELKRGLPPSQVRALVRPVDKSNFRRAIKSLVGRELVEVDHELGRLVLTFWGAVWARHKGLGKVPDPLEEAREHRRKLDAAMAALREHHEAQRSVYREVEALWNPPECSAERYRHPGPNQLRVISALVRYAEDPQMGLPKGALWRIVQGPSEKANTLRAIRTLLRRGTLQRSKDGGKRVRLTYWRTAAWLWGYAADVVKPPLNDAKAEAVLENFGESKGCRVTGTPHGGRKYFQSGSK
ncbi:MAG: hypothetical protein AVDCRST_MAG37-317 [uncultured Rubrobacteraceae bacterium]|uniref:Uncharacterized protein n=1 Tax=uncultured Rubrobacteraceae bacterium TaxID=349277 RepID=A0A6J4Q314_9ACTN|nr:MAG: hypothetical protein AVDCRST_MAG37-317 [uncultured Rubrobacteraceae bacterium]